MLSRISNQRISWYGTMVFLPPPPLQWYFKNSHAFHKFALHGLTVKVWCAVNAHKIIRPVVLKIQFSNIRRPPRSPHFYPHDTTDGWQWNMGFIRKIHILCMKWNVLFEEKLLIQHFKITAPLSRNIFRMYEACLELEVSALTLFYKIN
jgi:hypothetical protein